MGHFSISVSCAGSEPATLKVIRRFSTTSLAVLRQRLSTQEPVLSFSTTDYPLELDLSEGRQHQHAVIREAITQLEGVGCTLRLFYQPSHDYPLETINKAMMENLFESELLYLQQEHD